MTQLNCTVASCRYNEDSCCCKDGIMVEGKSATTSGETCCGSFAEKTSDMVKNYTGEPKKATDVSCKAEKCVHNENCQCKASGIDVAGRNACCCSETECGTFCCGQYRVFHE